MVLTQAAAAGDDDPLARPTPTQMIGFDVPVAYVEDADAARQQLRRVVDLGANAVRFLVPLYQPHTGSAEPRLDQRPRRGPTDADLLDLIRHARQLGLRTVVTPRIALTRPRGEDRLHQIDPPRWETWWIAYAQGVTHYAQLADRAGADVFGVADGIDAALDPTRHPEAMRRWDQLIADVRDRFHGPVVLWTRLDRAALVADAFDTDWIGVRPAVKFDEGDLRSTKRRESAMRKQWKRLGKQLDRQADDLDRPFAIGGVGLAANESAWHAAEYRPFAPAASLDHFGASTTVQTEAIRSFLEAWDDELSIPPGSGRPEPVAAVFFADWRLDGRGGPFDASHAMQGKPAEALLRRTFTGNHR